MNVETEIFADLDEDIRQLLTLVHNIKMDMITGKYGKEKIEKALFLTQKIETNLYSLYISEKR